MGLIRQVELCSLESRTPGSGTQFFMPQNSDQTMMVQMPPAIAEDLFVHHFQTDQLFVVRGSFVLVVLLNRRYHYIPLTENQPTMVRIPPGVPHGGINLETRPCVLINAVIRHGEAHPRDYTPIPPPFPYDLDRAAAQLQRQIEAFPCKSETACVTVKPVAAQVRG